VLNEHVFVITLHV